MTEDNFTKAEKIQLLTKIDDVKFDISETEMKKSGKNTFQKYNYFELKDFMPTVRKLCKKYKLATEFHVKNNLASLHVFDLETGYSRYWTHELPSLVEFAEKNGEKVPVKETELEKIKGALETYGRRYLYLAFLELTDGDAIDSGDVTAPKKQSKGKKKYPTPKETVNRVKQELGDKYSLEEAEKLLQKWLKNDETTEGIIKLTMNILTKEGE